MKYIADGKYISVLCSSCNRSFWEETNYSDRLGGVGYLCQQCSKENWATGITEKHKQVRLKACPMCLKIAAKGYLSEKFSEDRQKTYYKCQHCECMYEEIWIRHEWFEMQERNFTHSGEIE